MAEEKQRYTISEAVAILQSEFPDLTASSLRFLEKEQLLHPQRSQGGHRLYRDTDLARIRLIKRLQSRRYYPLETIRHMLVKLEQGGDLEAEIAFLESLYAPLSYDPHFVPLSSEQLAERTGLPVSGIAQLEAMGLLFPSTNGNGTRRYDEDDLKVAELLAQEVRLGARLDEFASYSAAMRTLVQEEISLFYQLAGGKVTAPERTRQLKEMADLVHTVLRAKLTRQLFMQVKRKE